MKRSQYRILVSAALLLVAVVSIVAFAFARTGAVQAAPSGTLYVAEGQTMPDGNLTVISAATNSVTSRILVGDANTALLRGDLVASSDGSKLYMLGYQLDDQGSGSPYMLYSVTATTPHVVTPISLPPSSNFPPMLVGDPTNPAVYVLFNDINGNGVVTTVSTVSDSATGSVSLPPNTAVRLSTNGVVDPAGKNLYFPVTGQNVDGSQTNSIGDFSLESQSFVRSIGSSGSNNFAQVGLSGDNSQLYGLVNGRIQVMTLATGAVANSIPCGGIFLQNTARQLVLGVTVDAVATIDSSKSNISAVTNIAPMSMQLLTPSSGESPEAATLSSDGKRLYVASAADNAVIVIDTAKLTIQTIIPVGANPQTTLFIP